VGSTGSSELLGGVSARRTLRIEVSAEPKIPHQAGTRKAATTLEVSAAGASADQPMACGSGEAKQHG
jgi:hypothetical protein